MPEPQHTPRKRLVILGATGSIGRNALRVVARHPDRFEVAGLVAGRNTELLAEQAAAFSVPWCYASDPGALAGRLPSGCVCVRDWSEVTERLCDRGVDQIVCAAVGTCVLQPVLEALAAGRDLALATKELIVAAGELVMATAARSGARILPVDSEHSAIFQCLEGRAPESVLRLVLSASGGPFRTLSGDALRRVTYAQTLLHPTWSMGPKITVDSATLMNKGLELIEARWLFGVDPDRIDVVVHPQSIVHSLVEFVDGTFLAQLGPTDMRLAIQYALTWPERRASDVPRLSLTDVARLDFEAPDETRFPALGLARRALAAGGTLPAVLNAANDRAVAAFADGRIGFLQIPAVVEQVMAAHTPVPATDLGTILEAESWASSEAETRIRRAGTA